MKKDSVKLRVAEIGFIAATRVGLGVGIGLMIADRFTRAQRRSMARRLITMGVVTTLPIVARIASRKQSRFRLAA